MLDCVERLHVEADEPPVGIFEQRPRPGGKVGEARADPEDHVRFGRDRVGSASPGDADRAHRQGMVGRRRRLAGLGLGDRNPPPCAEVDQLALRIGIEDAAAADHERLFGLFHERGGVLDLARVRRDAPHSVHTFFEKLAG